jgi:hypothetical protein
MLACRDTLQGGRSGIESRWGRDFGARPDGPWCLPSLLYNWYRVCLLGLNWPGRSVDQLPPSNTDAKERVELYLYSQNEYYLCVLYVRPVKFHSQFFTITARSAVQDTSNTNAWNEGKWKLWVIYSWWFADFLTAYEKHTADLTVLMLWLRAAYGAPTAAYRKGLRSYERCQTLGKFKHSWPCWQHWGEYRYCSIQTSPRPKREGSGQLHSTSALVSGEAPLNRSWISGWVGSSR